MNDRITNPVLGGFLGNVFGINSGLMLSIILSRLINFGFIIGVVVFIFNFLLGAYGYISSGGDKEAVQRAVKRITGALIGLTILFSLYALLGILSAFFGLNLVSLPIPDITGAS